VKNRKPEEQRPPARRAQENEIYRGRQAAAGIVRITVMVPAERIPYLKALTLEWRRESKMMLEQDQPTSDQILQIHAVYRTLDLPLPERAFASRGDAQEWLLAQEPNLGQLMLHRPKRAHRP
jgi:hypothetical protein